jgi:hypothetical protein
MSQDLETMCIQMEEDSYWRAQFLGLREPTMEQ